MGSSIRSVSFARQVIPKLMPICSLADRFRQAGGILDDCVIGWDSMNEPSEGFIGISDLREFPEAQSVKYVVLSACSSLTQRP